MSKITIELPSELPFSTEIPIQIFQINGAQHLDNALLIGLVQEARHRFLQSLGCSWDNAEGLKCVVRDEQATYRSEAFYGEIMRIEMGLIEELDTVLAFGWKMRESKSGREVARGIVDVEFLNPQTSEIEPIPLSLAGRILKPCGDA